MEPKGINELIEQLAVFEQDVIDAVSVELLRLGRTVAMGEFDFIPFREDVQPYVNAIRLDEEGSPLLETSFTDLSEKYLSSFISDNEIDHWDMIALLRLLKDTAD